MTLSRLVCSPDHFGEEFSEEVRQEQDNRVGLVGAETFCRRIRRVANLVRDSLYAFPGRWSDERAIAKCA